MARRIIKENQSSEQGKTAQIRDSQVKKLTPTKSFIISFIIKVTGNGQTIRI